MNKIFIVVDNNGGCMDNLIENIILMFNFVINGALLGFVLFCVRVLLNTSLIGDINPHIHFIPLLKFGVYFGLSVSLLVIAVMRIKEIDTKNCRKTLDSMSADY